MKTVKNENENYEEEKLAAKNHPTNCFNFISDSLTLWSVWKQPPSRGTEICDEKRTIWHKWILIEVEEGKKCRENNYFCAENI